MNYYLTKTICKTGFLTDRQEVIQLVKASTPENAEIAVEKAARKEFGDDIIIYEIRVQETLIGK